MEKQWELVGKMITRIHFGRCSLNIEKMSKLPHSCVWIEGETCRLFLNTTSKEIIRINSNNTITKIKTIKFEWDARLNIKKISPLSIMDKTDHEELITIEENHEKSFNFCKFNISDRFQIIDLKICLADLLKKLISKQPDDLILYGRHGYEIMQFSEECEASLKEKITNLQAYFEDEKINRELELLSSEEFNVELQEVIKSLNNEELRLQTYRKLMEWENDEESITEELCKKI